MEAATSESIPCENCRKIAGHIRAWTESVRSGRSENFLGYETVGRWKDFVDARACPTCVKLVQFFSEKPRWLCTSRPAPPNSLAFEPDQSGWRECEIMEPDPGDLLKFFGDHSYNRFTLWRKSDENGGHREIPYCLYLTPPQPYGPDGGGHHVETQYGDGTIDIEQFKRWLSYCDSEHHGHCHSIKPDHFFQFPDRIILIDLKNNKLTVCETKVCYVALSYVWGKPKAAFETLQSNVSDLSKDGGLSRHWDELPLTIKDAMILCRSLSIPYLWVDRLCIIQDDENSKQQNISWMASIYANCYFAIIAAEGSDDDHGIRGVSGVSGPRQGQFTFQFSDIQCGLENKKESKSVWHTRGWTFQGRTLARRCLVFHDRRVHWECENIRIDENVCMAEGGTEIRTDRQYSFELKDWPDPLQYGGLCFEFSQRKFTYDKDVMDAFTSTTNALTRSFPGGFLYAMPEYMFTLSLLWTHGWRSEHKRRAWLPSWSWIGWEGCIPSMKDLYSPVFEAEGDYDDNFHDFCHGSMSRWMKRNTLTGELVAINDSFYFWEKFEREPMVPLPDGWAFIQEAGSRGFVHEELTLRGSRIRFCHPVPIAKPGLITPDLNIWDTLIHGVVPLASLWFDKKSVHKRLRQVPLHDARGELVGFMDVTPKIYRQIEQDDECSVICLCQIVQNTNLTGRDLTREPVVQVMWVVSEGDIAYRRGIGRIPLSKWAMLDTKEVEIVLG